MKRFVCGFILWLGLGLSLLALAATRAHADALTGTYFKVPITHPDVQKGIDFATVTGLVAPTLGPSGLPVASAFGQTYAGPSGPITDLNANGEIRWWSTSSPFGVLFEKMQVDPLPLNFPFNFFSDGQPNNSTFFRAVHWQGTFDLPVPGAVTFTLGSDDDAWIFVDGQLKVDNGGVHALISVPNVIAGLGAGIHPVDVFFADRHTTQSGIQFSANIALEPAIAPEPSTLFLVGSGLAGLGAVACRRHRSS